MSCRKNLLVDNTIVEGRISAGLGCHAGRGKDMKLKLLIRHCGCIADS
jgi:hypothetical protein